MHIKERHQRHSLTSSGERKDRNGVGVLISERAAVVVVIVVGGSKNYLKQPRECDWGVWCVCVSVRVEKDLRRRKGGKKKGVIPHKSGSRFPIPLQRMHIYSICVGVCSSIQYFR